jgi:hypothetical protein
MVVLDAAFFMKQEDQRAWHRPLPLRRSRRYLRRRKPVRFSTYAHTASTTALTFRAPVRYPAASWSFACCAWCPTGARRLWSTTTTRQVGRRYAGAYGRQPCHGARRRDQRLGYPAEWGMNVPSKDFGEKMQM